MFYEKENTLLFNKDDRNVARNLIRLGLNSKMR